MFIGATNSIGSYSMATVYYYMAIFHDGKENPQYQVARNFLRSIYGRGFIDTEYHEDPKEFNERMIEFYTKLWKDDEEQPEENKSRYEFDSMLAFAQYRKDHPEEFRPSIKLSEAAQKYFSEENQLIVIDSLPQVFEESVITTAVSEDENEIIGNNREARRKRAIKKNRHKTKHKWRFGYDSSRFSGTSR